MRRKPALDQEVRRWLHKAAQYQPDVTVFVQLMRHKDANLHLTKHLRLDRAQLMRHKDANLHLTAGFQKAALYQPYLSIETSLHI